MRARYSSYVDQALVARLRRYAAALGRSGQRVSLSGLHEAALYEYLEQRCLIDGSPRDGVGPAPRSWRPGRGRPSAAALEARFRPRLDKTAGRPAGE